MLASMEIIYFTLAAILLYLAADWILRRIESAAGKPLQYRNLIFFVILLTMAVTSFALIRNLGGE
jgi:DMSO/TMAO reductase YedYZ heme-binding membrane subunit